MNRPVDLWIQRISLGTLVLLAAALLGVGVALYAPGVSPPSPLTEVLP